MTENSKLTESEMRPAEVKRRFLELVEKEWETWLDANGRLRSDLAQIRDCPVCKTPSSQAESFTSYKGFQFLTCPECSMVYRSPILREDVLLNFWDKSEAYHFYHQHFLKSKIEYRRKQIFESRVSYIERWLSAGRILEIGCSMGFALDLLKNRGFKTVGIELNEEAVKFAREEYGLEVYTKPLRELDLPADSFDAVMAWELAEHLVDPFREMELALKVLRPGGYLFLSMPNIDGIEHHILEEDHFQLRSPTLLNFFSPKTTSRMLQQVGFDILEISTPGVLDLDNVMNFLEEHPVGKLDSYLVRLKKNNQELYSDFRHHFIQFTQANKLSSHMMVTAKRGQDEREK